MSAEDTIATLCRELGARAILVVVLRPGSVEGEWEAGLVVHGPDGAVSEIDQATLAAEVVLSVEADARLRALTQATVHVLRAVGAEPHTEENRLRRERSKS